jgi:hypothetical protein
MARCALLSKLYYAGVSDGYAEQRLYFYSHITFDRASKEQSDLLTLEFDSLDQAT